MAEKFNKHLDDFSELEAEKATTKAELAEMFSEVSEDFKKRLRIDHGVTFYKVQKGDNLRKIHNTLIKIDGYKYLDDPFYTPATWKYVEVTNKDGTKSQKKVETSRNKVGGWNVPAQGLVPGMEIPVPLRKEDRRVNVENYLELSQSILLNLEGGKYDSYVRELWNMDPDHLARLIKTISVKESNAGATALYRWEANHNAYSYTQYHFLFNDGSPFKAAMKELGYTVGEIMTDYTKATTVAFAGIIEKAIPNLNAAKYTDAKKFTKENFSGGLANFLREENVFNFGWWYNGLNTKGKSYASDFEALYKRLKEEEQGSPQRTVGPQPKEVLPAQKPVPKSKPPARVESREDEIEYEVDFQEIGRSKDDNYSVHKLIFDKGTWYLAPGEIEYMFAAMNNVDQKLVRLTDVHGKDPDIEGGIPSRSLNPQRPTFYIKYLDIAGDYAEKLRKNDSTFVRLYSYPDEDGNEVTVYGFKPDIWFENTFSGNNWTVLEIEEEFQRRLKKATGKVIPLSRIRSSDILGRMPAYREEQVIVDKADEDMDQFDTDINKVFLHVSGAHTIEQLK